MAKAYIVLLVGYSLYMSGADDQNDLRRERLKELGRKMSDLGDYHARCLVQGSPVIEDR